MGIDGPTMSAQSQPRSSTGREQPPSMMHVDKSKRRAMRVERSRDVPGRLYGHFHALDAGFQGVPPACAHATLLIAAQSWFHSPASGLRGRSMIRMNARHNLLASSPHRLWPSVCVSR
jgi:hypothetical protein